MFHEDFEDCPEVEERYPAEDDWTDYQDWLDQQDASLNDEEFDDLIDEEEDDFEDDEYWSDWLLEQQEMQDFENCIEDYGDYYDQF